MTTKKFGWPRRTGAAASGFAGFLLFLLIPFISGAGIISPELEQALGTGVAGNRVPVIVTLHGGVQPSASNRSDSSLRRPGLVKALRDTADVSQRQLTAWLRRHGARDVRQLWTINGLAVSASPEVIRQLEALPEVAGVRLDSTLNAPEAIPGAASTPGWNLEAIRALELWSLGHTGSGVVVASMDTGVDLDHPDLASRWRGGTNSWFDPNGEHATPFDALGHGTQTMGLAVGGGAGGTTIGTAPDASWIAVKMFDDAGEARLSAIHAGFQWLLDPDGDPSTADAPDVVYNSWSFPSLVDQCFLEFETDIALLKAAGIAVIFSAGNLGPNPFTSVSPANGVAGFSVGAVDESLTVTTFSSRGPSACDGSVYPQVVVPGANVRTADLTFGGVFPDSYTNVTGTSFAAPHVAGAIALLRGAFPDVTVAALEDALEQSALDLGEAGPDDHSGYGLIDVMEAHQFLSDLPACTDADGDGYAVDGGPCGPVDCNDGDFSINPGLCSLIDPAAQILADVRTEAKNPSTNFGPEARLSADADSEKNTLIKVSVTGTQGAVTSATLKLSVPDVRRADSDSGGRIQQITDCTWSEDSVTFLNQPLLDGIPGPPVGPVDRGDEVLFDVSTFIQDDGTYCFAITSDLEDGVDYTSREAELGGPELLVTADCSCQATPTGSSTTISTSTSTTTTTSTIPAASTTTTQPPTTTITAPPTTSTTTTTTTTSTTTNSTTTTSTASPTTTTQATSTTTTLPPVVVAEVLADVKTEAKNPDTNFGADEELSADADSEKNTLIRVNVAGTGGVVASAALRLTVRDVKRADSDSGGRIQEISDCAWNEGTVTFANQPPLDGTPGPDVGPVDRGEAVMFDVSDYVVDDGVYCFAITSDSGNGVDYHSREGPTGQPELIVNLGP